MYLRREKYAVLKSNAWGAIVFSFTHDRPISAACGRTEEEQGNSRAPNALLVPIFMILRRRPHSIRNLPPPSTELSVVQSRNSEQSIATFKSRDKPRTGSTMMEPDPPLSGRDQRLQETSTKIMLTIALLSWPKVVQGRLQRFWDGTAFMIEKKPPQVPNGIVGWGFLQQIDMLIFMWMRLFCLTLLDSLQMHVRQLREKYSHHPYLSICRSSEPPI